MKIREGVLKILESDERARNDDHWLIWKYIREIDKINMFIPFEDFKRMTSFESITRMRRELQNDSGLYPPTNSVIANRRAKEQRFKRREIRW